MSTLFEQLSKLNGSWKGEGHGNFPTIDSFEYEEQLDFEVNLAYPLIHYQQKTILISSQEPSHWESGFIRVLDDEVIEISNSQDSGRVEVMLGRMSKCTDTGFEMEFESTLLGNDPGMIQE